MSVDKTSLASRLGVLAFLFCAESIDGSTTQRVQFWDICDAGAGDRRQAMRVSVRQVNKNER